MNKKTYRRPEAWTHALPADAICGLAFSDTPADPKIPMDAKEQDDARNVWSTTTTTKQEEW